MVMPYAFRWAFRLLAVCCVLLWGLVCALPTQAHRVNIFAWLEGETVVVECGFSRSSPVKNGQITVVDAVSGAELLQGRTDDQGMFRFPVPQAARQGHGLRLVLAAGEGHANTWTMDAEEFAPLRGAPAVSQAAPAAQAVAAGDGASLSPESSGAAHSSAAGMVPLEAVRQVVDSALEARLAPIRRELAALNTSEPTVRDIVGGIGWILGLVGIACYFRRR